MIFYLNYKILWRVCCCIWYSEERPGRAVAPSSAVLAVPNIGLTNAPYIIAHATTHQRPVYQLHVIQCFKILIVTRCLHASWLYQTWATAGCCPNSGRSRSLYSTCLAYSDTKTTNNRVCHPIRRDLVHQSNIVLRVSAYSSSLTNRGTSFHFVQTL